MREAIPERAEAAARACVHAALTVHKRLGPGLMESVYQHCLAYELRKAKVACETQVQLPVRYDGVTLEAGFRVDLMLDQSLIVQIKSVSVLLPIHEMQMLTYLKLSGIRLGLLINFNVSLIKDGIDRIAL